METELALQRLSEAREVLDGETAELVDALARVVMIQKDIRAPMVGAKITLYTQPATDLYMCPRDEVPSEIEGTWQEPLSTDDPEYWKKWGFEWLNGEPSDEPDEVVKVKIKKSPDDPDIVQHKALTIDGNIAESAPDTELWDPDKQEYNHPEDYPTGTVNCIVAYPQSGDSPHNQHVDIDKIQDFENDYPTDVAVFTSVIPADGEPGHHTYTPGWPDK